MKKKNLYLGLFVLLLFSCSKNKDSETEEMVEFVAPAHFPAVEYNFDENPISQKGFELGKRLFMDGILSRDNSISCASCHATSAAFTQHGHSLSHGIDNRLTKRNALPIQNLAWNTSFAWDGGINHLDLFAPLPITNPSEMDDALADVLEKLKQHSDYPALFEEAFSDGKISTANFLKALSQFQLMCISDNSLYDGYVKGEEQFSASQLAGLEVFNSKCSSCHTGVLQTDHSFRNNGLEVRDRSDLGRAGVTEDANDNYKFRVPTLRNLKYTKPYMHDGRFETLDEVLNHYSQGMVDGPTLDSAFRHNGAIGIELSSDDKENLKTFLNTLNDESFVNNKQIRVF
jgi:cytochrome c peroxidase